MIGNNMLRMRNDEHGSPYDRGTADSWYRRPRQPHFYPHGTYNGKAVTVNEMADVEIDAYNKGYDDNEASGGHKEW